MTHTTVIEILDKASDLAEGLLMEAPLHSPTSRIIDSGDLLLLVQLINSARKATA